MTDTGSLRQRMCQSKNQQRWPRYVTIVWRHKCYCSLGCISELTRMWLGPAVCVCLCVSRWDSWALIWIIFQVWSRWRGGKQRVICNNEQCMHAQIYTQHILLYFVKLNHVSVLKADLFKSTSIMLEDFGNLGHLQSVPFPLWPIILFIPYMDRFCSYTCY